MKLKLIIISVLLISAGILSAQSWKEIKTVEELCTVYPETMENMLDQFDLSIPGLEKVKSAKQAGNLVQACKALLEYYKTGNNSEYLRKNQPAETMQTNAEADTILKNVFVIQNVRGEVPWLADGHRDWYYKGPNNDREWAWLSNRHTQLNHVYQTFLETGNPKYAVYMDEMLRDFIIKSMPYPEAKGSESIWRGLEVSFRAKIWTSIFYGMINNSYFTPATQLLMLSSLPDHAHYNRNFHGGNNWLTMEISGLATIATAFPEYKNSKEWMDYSVKVMGESMKDQVYPDGIQTELTSHYHNVSLRNFVLFKEICDRANYSLPAFFNETIEKMYSYIAHAVRPDGSRILNNDGDRGSDVELILEGAKKYNHPEWEYIVTNGKSGVKPEDGPSYFYPWAGQLISRSSFDSLAHWSFFDVGPWGSGHQHNDKLHLSISAYGRDLLVDAGRFAYTGAIAQKFRPYARGTQGHNAILFDGKGQQADVLVSDKPLTENHWKITPEFDYAWNSFDKYIDVKNVSHNRSLMYVRGEFWVVVDKIKTEKPRTIQTLWHWHPECRVEQETGGIVYTTNKRGNLKIIPLEKRDWNVIFVKGQEQPEIQGWYSEEYNKFESNTTSICSTGIKGDEVFVWILVPFESDAPKVDARVISKDKNEIRLEVSQSGKGKWDIFIPYTDSKKANIRFTNL